MHTSAFAGRSAGADGIGALAGLRLDAFFGFHALAQGARDCDPWHFIDRDLNHNAPGQ